MSKLGKSRKIGISVAVACCMLLAIIFFADIKNLFVLAADALSALISTDETTDTSTTIVMRTDDAYDVYETDGYYAFSVYAPSTATYTIGVTAENGSVRVNTGEAISVNGTEMSVSLTEGTNVLYIMGCSSPSIQWERETCDLEPINKVCALVAGDLDQNGERTLLELIRLKKEAAIAGTLTTDALVRTEIADIDRDNSITDEDARLLRELLVGNPRYEASELRAVIVDAYLVDSTTNTAVLYDALADAFTAASTESTANSNKEVTVTVVKPTDVYITEKIVLDGGVNILLTDDGATDNGWSRTITRASTLKEEMFAVAEATLTLDGSSDSDEHSSLILDGGAISASSNHFVDVGNANYNEGATLIMDKGVKLTNNVNTGQGGAIAVQTRFIMNGGIISGNLANGAGGAIVLLGSATKNEVTVPAATMTMSGGIITENESTKELYSSGGVSISGGATLNMTGGEIYNNITPVSLDNNSVRKSGTSSVFTMGDNAYVDRVCFDTTGVNTHCVELTSKLTTTKDITLFFTQPLNSANPVVKRDSSISECDALFKLSEHMVPCQLVQDDSNENLCLRSDVTDMETVVVGEEPVYSSSSDSAFQALGISGSDWTVQGVCADDTYLYMAIAQSPSVGCRILKVKLGTWEYVDCSDAMLRTDHSNEMTYNPNTGKIYITHCISEGAGSTTDKTGPYAISIVDPANLNVLEDTIYLSDSSAYTGTTGISALAYNATQDYYVASGTGFRFGFLKGATGEDATYSITETTMPSTGLKGFTGYTAYTKQGVYATDTTIYANTWYDITNVTGEEQNFLTIYDWSGNYHGTQYIVNLDGSAFTGEIESLFEYNGTMYMACFPKDYSVVAEVYALSDVGKTESTIDVINDATGIKVDGVYTNLSDAIGAANELDSATIVLHTDVTIGATQTITGNVTIKDDGTQRTLQRSIGCTAEMFNVAGGSELTFTSSSTDDSNPMLVIDGNKANVSTSGISPVVKMNQTDGILNITAGVIVQNNKSANAGGVIYAGANKSTSAGGGLAVINITGGLFAGNEIVNSSTKWVFGGCIYIENGCTLNVSDATFENTKMAQNTTDGLTYGGVISVRTNASQTHSDKGASVILTNCTFKNTTVTQSDTVKENGGGVLQIGDGNPQTVQITDCTFIDNKTEGLGGAIYMANTKASFDLSGCNFSNNNDVSGPNDIYMAASTNVNVFGNTQANINCAGTEQIHITESLGTESAIQVNVSNATVGATVATFGSEAIMADCKAKGYLILPNEGYALSYETTSASQYVAKLASAVATIDERGYASLADAIEAANALDSATIVLKADVTVDAPQTITGNVTITDDGTAWTITREGFTDQMFVVESDAGLTFTATGTDNTSPTLTIDGNGEVAGASGAMVSLGTGNGILAVNHAVRFTNTNINEDGGIISTEDGSTATVTINGGVFDNNTAEISGAVSGGLIKVVGEAEVTISNALFRNNTIKSTGGALKGGIMYVGGGTVNVVGSTFTSNTAYTKTTGAGGVIAAYGGTIHIGKYTTATNETIEGTCYFTDNTFNSSGNNKAYGGAIAISEAGANVYVYNTTVQNNTAYAGGGIHVASDATLTVGDSTITDNTSTGNSVRTNLNAVGRVELEGKINASLFCQTENKLHIKNKLSEGSEVKLAWLMTANGIVEGETFATFENAEVMADCKEKGYIILVDNDYVSSQDHALSYETISDSEYIAKLTSSVATIGERGYASLADAINAANALDSATIVLKADVTVDATQTITGNVTIKDDGTQRTLQRTDGCTNEMFNVAGGAGLTFTSSSKDDSNPMLVIDGNKANIEIESAAYAPVVDMNQTNGILNITPGVIVQNNKSKNTGGVIFAGLNGTTAKSGSQATINITGGLFTGNEVEYSASKYLFGGCIYIESGCTLNISNATFENTTMAQNYAGGMTYGGVISVRTNASHLYDGANVTLENCIFKNTSVTQKGSGNGGGVLYIGASNPSSVQVTNCEFTGNATEGLGGAIYMSNTTTALDLSGCSFSGNTDANGTNDIYMVASTNVNVSGNTQVNINCAGTEQIHITESLGTESVIQMNVSNATAGATVATFASEEIMNACIANENLVLTNREYLLSYETTSNSEYIATLVDVVAMIGEQGYASFEDAIEAANALESATIVLKADATVDETQAITGNVTITDDGTARTLTRGAECTAQVFDVQEGASLTLAGTGTTTEEGTVQGTITVDGNKGEVLATNSMIVNAGTFNLGEHASLTNAGNESDTTTTGGALYNAGTATLAGTLSSNEAYKGGALYNASGTMTITGGTFESNSAYHGGVVYTAVGATLDITGGTFGTEGKGNTSGHRAGVVYVQEGTGTETIASATISNATFSYNSSYNSSKGTSAGVLYVGEYANVEIDGCAFSNNSADSSATTYGGSIYMKVATVEIKNSTFSNSSATRGGAVYMSNSTSNELTLHNCDFADNTATEFGRDVFYDRGDLILSGKIGNAQIDKRHDTINVVGNLDSTSKIEIMQISGTLGLAQVQFDSAEATQIGAQCITYYDYYTNSSGTTINSGLTLQFDTEKYQAIMK